MEQNEQIQSTEQVQVNEQAQVQVEEKQKQKNGKKYIAILLLLLILMGVSVGYAALTSSLHINGTSTINNASWEIDANDNDITCPSGQVCTINPTNPDELTPDDGKVTPSHPNPNGAIIWTEGNTIYFKHLLTTPGDIFTFNCKFTNSGTIDAKVSNVTQSSLNTTAQRFMDYTVTYADGSTIRNGDVLLAGNSASFKVTVSYKSSVTALPTSAELAQINETASGHTGATSFFTVTYEQA